MQEPPGVKKPLEEREVFTLEDVTLSYEKAMIADIVLSFTQTPQEKRNQRLRVHVAKQRNEAAGQVVPILTNFAKGPSSGLWRSAAPAGRRPG